MHKREATETVVGFEHRGQHWLEAGETKGLFPTAFRNEVPLALWFSVHETQVGL